MPPPQPPPPLSFSVWQCAHLGDAVQTAALLEHAAGNHVVSVGQEGEGEGADPPHHLAPVLAGAVLQHLHVRDHGVLWR